MAASRDRKVKQTLVLFIVTFLISLIVITYFIKSFSPNVDVEIGSDDSHHVENTETDSDVKQAIDDRLRWIQMEDNMPGASKREDGSPENEVVYEPEKVKKNDDKKDSDVDNKADKKLAPVDLNTSQVNAQKQVPVPAAPAEPPKMSKVYVGSYSSIEQAIQAQNKLMNTSISISPFVKEYNGAYVLQAGSYSTAGKAEALAREINSLGFSARVVKE